MHWAKDHSSIDVIREEASKEEQESSLNIVQHVSTTYEACIQCIV